MSGCIRIKSIDCIIQENGIIRRKKDMYLLGRLSDDFSYTDLVNEMPTFFYYLKKAFKLK